MNDTADRHVVRVVGTAVTAAVAAAMPGFLVGALSVQIRAEFGVSEGRYGWAMSGFFLGATAGSILLGRVAQRIGPRHQLQVALVMAAVADLAVAFVADDFVTLVVCVSVAGACNSGVQTAVNLALARARLERLGLAIAVKQSGMPAAAMLSGLAVPTVALTVGWRWAFVVLAVISAFATAAVRAFVEPGRDTTSTHDRPRSAMPSLVIAAGGIALLSFGAGALNAWAVESGVDAGLGDGTAGIVLSSGAALGIGVRLMWGLRIDRSAIHPFTIAAWMTLAGAVGTVLLAGRVAALHVVAVLVAFGCGWIWPVFTNFGIIRANEGHAAAATGVTQTGVYAGVFVAPLTTGLLIDTAGYPTMWLVSAAAMAAGAVVIGRVKSHF